MTKGLLLLSVTRVGPSIRTVLPHFESTAEVYRGMVDAAPDAMVVVDPGSGLIRLVNARAEVVFGWSRNVTVR